MKYLPICLLGTLLAAPAAAQPRPSTTSLPCRAAAALVARSGSIVLATGPVTFDRYVSVRRFCPRGMYARPAAVPTLDNPQCPVGFYCSSAPPLFGPGT